MKFKKDDRVVASLYGCGTVIGFKQGRGHYDGFDANMYEIDMDHVKTPKPVTHKGKVYQPKRPTYKCSEGGLTLLTDFLNGHKEYGSTYKEIMDNLRAEWTREHELNRLRRLGYVTDLGEYI